MRPFFHEIVVHPKKISAKIILHYPNELPFDSHWHEEIEILATMDSQVQVYCNQESYIAKENEIVCINSAQIHQFSPILNFSNSAITIQINPAFLKEYCTDPDNCYFDVRQNPDACQLLDSYMKELFLFCTNETENPYYNLRINSLLHQILYVLLSECQINAIRKEQAKTTKYRQRYMGIMTYMNEHYSEDLSLEDVAKFSHISKEHLSREFKTYVGENFRDHLANIRLRHAHLDLINTDLPLIDIAINHGFSDLRSYNRAFQKQFGIAPLQYRRKIKRCTLST